jgi:hypothetical protein
MERHCARTFVIAEELGRRGGHELDRELLLCAAWLHDAGLYPGAATKDTYVRDGRRMAQSTLADHGWDPARLTRLGDAIEYHHELRPQWDRGAEVELMRRADLVEVSQTLVTFGLPRGWLRGLRRQISPKGMVAEIGRLLAGALRERPGTIPRIFTAAG